MSDLLQQYANKAGIHLPQGVDIMTKDSLMALDAQPTAITTSSGGIPTFLTTGIDNKVIDVLLSPMKAVEVAGGEVKKGDWTTSSWAFPLFENTGEVSSYGDYSNNGNIKGNLNFVHRQPYHYQVVTKWGQLEMERAGLAKVDWASKLNINSVMQLNRYQNKTYFNGVAGLQNYGLLNDPALSVAIAPTTKALGGTTWANGTANEILADVTKLFKQLQTQAGGTVGLDTVMTLAISPLSEAYLTTTTIYNVNVQDLLKKNYPNLKIVYAVEYSTGSGELMQLIANNVEGQETVDCAFTEKLRAFPILPDLSAWSQKKMQGTYGAIIYRPALIAQMIGM